MNIKLPVIAAFEDYHEITDLEVILFQDFDLDIKVKELNLENYGFTFTADCGMLYYGLFYTGKLPSKQKIKKMLLKRALNEGWELQKE